MSMDYNGNPYVNKLSEQQVYQILFLYHEYSYTPNTLAPIFEVSKSTIRNIVNGRSRKSCYDCYHSFINSHYNDFLDITKPLIQ